MDIKTIKKKTIEWTNRHKIWLEDYNNDRNAQVTVLLSTYDRAIELERAILSVYQQSFSNWRLIILGDRCLEKTVDAANFYVELDQRIIFFNLFRCTKAYYGAEQKNFACKYMVQTPYVAYLDDDNYWKSNHLDLLMELIKGQALDLVYGGIEDHNKLCPHAIIKYRVSEIYEWNTRRVDTSSLLHKTSLVPEVAQWRERMRIGLDLAFVEDLIKRGAKHKGCSQPTIVYFDYPRDPKLRKGYSLADYYDFCTNQVQQQKSGVPL